MVMVTHQDMVEQVTVAAPLQPEQHLVCGVWDAVRAPYNTTSARDCVKSLHNT